MNILYLDTSQNILIAGVLRGAENFPRTVDAGKSGHTRILMGEIDAALGDFSALTQLLQGAFIENPPVSVKEGGFIRKGYDRDLDELRDIRDNGARMIAEIEAREREKAFSRRARERNGGRNGRIRLTSARPACYNSATTEIERWRSSRRAQARGKSTIAYPLAGV